MRRSKRLWWCTPGLPCSRPPPPFPSRGPQECVKAGITMLSIGHRPALKQFHSTIVTFDGCGGFSIDQLRPSDREGLREAAAAAAAAEGKGC